MQCPFCHEEVGSEDDLQIHCLVCTSAYAEPSTPRAPRVDSVIVRFRWVKSRPCFAREVHLISSLAGSVILHWKEDEGLYESDTTGVPVGQHICQLAVGGDVIPTETFEVNEESDVIFVIIEEGNFRETTTFEDSDRRASVRTSGGLGSEEESETVETHDRQQPPLDIESRERDSEASNGMSPLYRELLRHQLSHGEPSWVPGSGVQSPVMSETDLTSLAGHQYDESSISSTPVEHMEELLPHQEAESHSGDFSGQSDGLPSHPNGRGDDEQSDSETEEANLQPQSFSPVPSSHSERVSPDVRVPIEVGARDYSVISPLVIEAFVRESSPPVPEGPSGEENTIDAPSHTPQSSSGRDGDAAEETTHLLSPSDRHPTEHSQSATRASPLGSSVLDTGTFPANGDTDVSPGNHNATMFPQRHSPTGSVQSSSLFSSGLPSPVMSPRGRSLSDTGVTLVPRGNPPGSLNGQTQLPQRPQSLVGFVPTTAGLLTTLGGPPGPVSGAEESPPTPPHVSTVHRHSPTGSNHSSVVHPHRGTGTVDLPQRQQQQQGSRLSSHRNTPVLSPHNGSAAAGQHGTPTVHSPRQGTSGGRGSPTELLVEITHRRAAPAVTSRYEATEPIHAVLPSASQREREQRTPVLRRPDTGSPTELLMETAFRQHTPPVSSRAETRESIPAIQPSTGHIKNEHDTPISHRSSGRVSPTEHLTDTAYRRGSPVVRASHESASPVASSASPHLRHRDSGNSTPSVPSPRQRAPGPENSSRHTGPASELPSSESRVNHRESDHRTSLMQGQEASRTGTPTQRLQGFSHACSSRSSSVHSRPDHSPPRVFSPSSLPRESAIPSRDSAFAAVTGERAAHVGILPSEVEELRQERDNLARELRQRSAHYEAELRRVKSRNEDLQQQLMSIETVATLTKHDEDKTQALEEKIVRLNATLQGKEQEINTLQETVRGLERTNQQLKEEQESLKTVNELRLEDINRVNSDLQQQLSDLRRRSVEARKRQERDEEKILELQVLQTTQERSGKRLELENTNLSRQLKQTQQELDTLKAVTSISGSRVSRAKSETDLSRKFNKYSTYDKSKYSDLDHSTRTVSFASTLDSARLGTTRHSSLDSNYSRSRDSGVSPLIVNGHSPSRPESKRAAASPYSSVQDRVLRESYSRKVRVPRHRVGSLGEDSDVSDDLDLHATASLLRHQTRSPESSSSSLILWDQDPSLHQPRDTETGRRRRPHSYHGGSLQDQYNTKDDYSKSSQYQSLRDIGRHATSSASYSSNSSLLATTTHQPPFSKVFTKPFAPTSSDDIQLDMDVLVTRSRGQIGRGKVKYVGPLPGRRDTYIGIELGPGQVGKHDGSIDGQRLFTCKRNQGIFVSFSKVVMCYG